jgi:hypothetical protein
MAHQAAALSNTRLTWTWLQLDPPLEVSTPRAVGAARDITERACAGPLGRLDERQDIRGVLPGVFAPLPVRPGEVS